MTVDYFSDYIGRQTVAYTAVASAAALLFDFCITFDSEVRWTWGRKWGFTRIVFVISRYLPLVGVSMTAYYAAEATNGRITNYWRLAIVSYSGVYISFLGAFAAEVLVVLRTYVFWECDKKFLIVISVFTMATTAAILTIAGVDSSKSGNATYWHRVLKENQGTSIIYGLLTFYALVLMSLTVYKRFKIYRRDNSPLVATVYRDGVIYMLCMALVSLANCLTGFMLPLSYTTLLACPQILVHSTLASRILFNLRATSELQDTTIGGPVVSNVVFAQPTHSRLLWANDPELREVIEM
ncbi:hypothetical protein M405DRAFT_817969 [Rhizopogon salebrosus TDB-379]|nr:hypothetical protein M405DRAFT_817969 [Rhizopogon salebrosus TDB-379]